VDESQSWLLEVRLFKVRPGSRPEFDRISREGTIPLMRRFGITVLGHGPTLNDGDGWLLIRAFPSEQRRVEQSLAFYELPEWQEKYDAVVPPMIDSYHTAVLPASAELVDSLTRGLSATG
jgi:hypothetical protein